MLKKAEILDVVRKQKDVLFHGTKARAYTDAGLWKFLPLVYTKDEHDSVHPEKPLLGEGDEYAIIVFLYMLCCEDLMIPKSRQIRMSWFCATFALWSAMSAKHRRIAYQTKKEEDSYAQTTKGSKDPGGGRIDFIHRKLPGWLRDPHVHSGRGNLAGQINFCPDDYVDGVPVPCTGSKIIGMPQGAHQVRQYTLSGYINDESAFQDAYREAMVAVGAAVADGGWSISVSSVQSGSFFNEAVLNVPAWKRAHIMSHGDMEIHEVHPMVQKALDIWGIEWPKGMRSWKTNSGAWVLEVHYTADPKKDPARQGKKWYETVVQKPGYEGDYNSVGWQTEMEINYEAGGGDPVFPFLKAGCPIFIDGFRPDEIRGKMRFYAGYDYGSQNPSAFVVWAVDKEGLLYSVWELYEPCQNMADHVEKIKRCPYWDEIEKIVCDPSIMARTQQTITGLKTLGELFEEHGLYMLRGLRDQDVPMAQMLKSNHWSDPSAPRAFLTKATPNLNKEMMDLRWQEYTSAAIELRANRPEKIRQKNNHACDATFLLLADGVDSPIITEKKDDYGTFNYYLRQMKTEAYTREQKRSTFYVP